MAEMEKRSRKRGWPLLWIAAGSIVALIAGGLAYLLVDEAPPADEDLRFVRREVPASENAFQTLEVGEGDLVLPEDPQRYEPFGEEWDAEAVRPLLAKNAAALDRYDRSFGFPHLQAPEPRLFSNIGHIHVWRRLIDLASRRLAIVQEDGKEKEAFEEALKVVRFGRSIEGAGGCLTEYLVGAAIHHAGVGHLQALLARTRLPAGDLRPFFDTLERLRPEREAFRSTFKVEYGIYSAFLDGLAEGEVVGNVPQQFRDLARTSDLWRRTVLRRNQTKRMYVEAFRAFLKDFEEGASNSGKEYTREVGNPWWPPRNVLGKSIYSLLALNGGPMARFRELDLQVSVARLLFALKAFRETHGALPTTLDELVPACIDRVPLDPFDGKPLRYSMEKKIVWSVGWDLKDRGGSTLDAPEYDFNEPTFRVPEQ